MRPRKVRTRERYILDSIPKIFKGGEWIEQPSQNGGGGVSDQGGRVKVSPENSTSSRYMTVIGGQKYDIDALCDAMARFPLSQIVVGCGRGVESDIGKAEDGDVVVISVDPDRYGKNARKVNVEAVLSFAPESPLLLVGEGERVKQARAWLKRARWPREVIELP